MREILAVYSSRELIGRNRTCFNKLYHGSKKYSHDHTYTCIHTYTYTPGEEKKKLFYFKTCIQIYTLQLFFTHFSQFYLGQKKKNK